MNDVESQRIVFRDGALSELPAILHRYSARRVLLVADEAAYFASGAAEQLADDLRARTTVRFSDFHVNPRIADLEQGISLYRELRPDVVIGLGGGTALDLAKLIAVFACQIATARELVVDGKSIVDARVPLVAIPTTAGTGSESTHFAVVYCNGVKHSVEHASLLPDEALIDPLLTHSMPASVTAATGLDALCQAIESIWAVGATAQSVGYATLALQLGLANLEAAVNRPAPPARRAMCEAAHLSGRAINISKTTAPHALSYCLTINHGVPHGVAVALFLGPLLEYNAQVRHVDCNDPRGEDHVRRRVDLVLQLLGVSDPCAGRAKISRLIAAVGCPTTLGELGIVGPAALEQLVAQANNERLGNNPRRIRREVLIELLDRPHVEAG